MTLVNLTNNYSAPFAPQSSTKTQDLNSMASLFETNDNSDISNEDASLSTAMSTEQQKEMDLNSANINFNFVSLNYNSKSAELDQHASMHAQLIADMSSKAKVADTLLQQYSKSNEIIETLNTSLNTNNAALNSLINEKNQISGKKSMFESKLNSFDSQINTLSTAISGLEASLADASTPKTDAKTGKQIPIDQEAVNKIKKDIEQKKAALAKTTQEKTDFEQNNKEDFDAQINLINSKISETSTNVKEISGNLNNELISNCNISLKQAQAESSYKEASVAVKISALKETEVKKELEVLTSKRTQENDNVQYKTQSYQEAVINTKTVQSDVMQRKQAAQLNMMG